MTENDETKELVSKTLVIVDAIEKKVKAFGKSVLILSIVDCIFGIISIFCTSLTIVAFLASAASLTTISIGGSIIQISKLRKLEQALRPVNAVALAWFINKYRKYLKTKKEAKVKTEKLSAVQIASIVGAVVGIVFAIVSIFVPQIAIAGDCVYNILVATGIEGICAFAGTFKRYKKLTDEEISKLQTKKEEKAKIAQEKEVAHAKAELERIENLKKIVADAEAKQTNQNTNA